MSATKASQAAQAIKAFLTSPSKYENKQLHLNTWFLDTYMQTLNKEHSAYKLHSLMQCLGNPFSLLNILNIDESILNSYNDKTLINNFINIHIKQLLDSYNILNDKKLLNKLSHLLLNIDRMLYDYDNDML